MPRPPASSRARAGTNVAIFPKTFSRPVYPYPPLPRYDGRSDANAPASYTRGNALPAWEMPAWAGSDFFQPYAPRAQ